jgi:hypothetical protein
MSKMFRDCADHSTVRNGSILELVKRLFFSLLGDLIVGHLELGEWDGAIIIFFPYLVILSLDILSLESGMVQ